MDIEGAEYQVVNKMIEDSSIFYIDKMRLEFHYDKINLEKSVHDGLLNKLKGIFGNNLTFKENKIKNISN